MKLSSSAEKLRQMIEAAIEDHKLTSDEYEKIISLATEDGIVDSQEQALLSLLKDMIEDKTVRMVAR